MEMSAYGSHRVRNGVGPFSEAAVDCAKAGFRLPQSTR